MKVLMLGWEFPPRRSGGLGTACQGIAEGLVRGGVDLTFLMPSERRGCPTGDLVRGKLRGDRGAAQPGWAAALDDPLRPPIFPIPSPHPPGEDRRRPRWVSGHPADSFPIGSFSSPDPAADSLRVLRVASPLTPYGHGYPAQPAHHASPPAPAPPYAGDLFSEIERFADRAALAALDLDFDVLHAHDWMTLPAALRIQEQRARPLVWHVHSTELDRSPHHPNPAIRAVEQLGLERAQRIVTVSHYTARLLLQNYRLDPARLRVVHNAALPSAECPSRGVRESGGRPLVLFLGRLTAQKGPEDFLRAAARVLPVLPDARFVLAGSGDLYPQLVGLARRLGILHGVHFTGFLEGLDVERMFARADVYVMPSISEPFGISALEAMSADVPVIVSSRSGVAEVLPSAPRVDPGDVAGLADRILELLSDADLRARLVARGRAEIQNLHWEERARCLMAIYRELAA